MAPAANTRAGSDPGGRHRRDERQVLSRRHPRRAARGRAPAPDPVSVFARDGSIEALDERIDETEWPRVGVGFPGEFIDGHVVRPGNLSRPGGVTTDVDPELEARVAGLRAPGRRCVRRPVVTCGSSMTPRWRRSAADRGSGRRDWCSPSGPVSASPLAHRRANCARSVTSVPKFRRGKTYDQTIGEHSRSMDEEHWGELLVMAVDGFVRRIRRDHGPPGRWQRASGDADAVRGSPSGSSINGNQASIAGAAKLFYN